MSFFFISKGGWGGGGMSELREHVPKNVEFFMNALSTKINFWKGEKKNYRI